MQKRLTLAFKIIILSVSLFLSSCGVLEVSIEPTPPSIDAVGTATAVTLTEIAPQDKETITPTATPGQPAVATPSIPPTPTADAAAPADTPSTATAHANLGILYEGGALGEIWNLADIRYGLHPDRVQVVWEMAESRGHAPLFTVTEVDNNATPFPTGHDSTWGSARIDLIISDLYVYDFSFDKLPFILSDDPLVTRIGVYPTFSDAHLGFSIGLKEPSAFEIYELTDPVRIVISIPYAGTNLSEATSDWQERPPGLVYRTTDALYQINEDEQPFALGNFEGVLSPDGTQLLSYDFSGQDIWLHNLVDGSSKQLTHTPDRAESFFQWWPHRSDLIIFNSKPVDAEPGPGLMGYLTLASLTGDTYEILDPNHDTGPTQFDLSPDGQTIAYGGGDIGWLYRLDSGPEPFDPASYGLTGTKGVQLGSPAWSPDGTKIAWMVNGGFGDNGELLLGIGLFDLVNQTATLLHPYEPMGRGGWPFAPVWSPNGRWLAFAVGPVNLDEAGVWVARADGSKEEYYFGYGGTPVWSPDGRWLAFNHIREDGVPEILAADTSTWQTRPVNLPFGDYFLIDWGNPTP